MRTGLLAALALGAGLSALAAVNPASLLSPRPAGWVLDQAGLLSAAAETELNRLGDTINAHTGGEIAVVTLRSTAGADPRRFATDLFNHWGIGASGRNNGLLLFVAIDDRAAEIILGDGIDSDAEVAASEEIMQQLIVPRFRSGRSEEAILAGARACADRFYPGASPPDVAVTPVERASAAQAAPALAPRSSPDADLSPSIPRSLVPARDLPAARGSPGLAGIVAAVGGAGAFGSVGWVVWRSFARRRRRKCRACGREMSRLDETADDAHLDASERTEEAIGSVDYDIWLCPWCSVVEKVRYGRWFTRFARCPKCGAVTNQKVSTTLVAATTRAGGLVRVDETCAHCDHRSSHTRTTPRLSASSSSSGRSSGFGGGRSSGRGSSGRW